MPMQSKVVRYVINFDFEFI